MSTVLTQEKNLTTMILDIFDFIPSLKSSKTNSNCSQGKNGHYLPPQQIYNEPVPISAMAIGAENSHRYKYSRMKQNIKTTQNCKDTFSDILNVQDEFQKHFNEFIEFMYPYQSSMSRKDKHSHNTTSLFKGYHDVLTSTLITNRDYTKYKDYAFETSEYINKYFQQLTSTNDEIYKTLTVEVNGKTYTFVRRKFDKSVNGIQLAQYYSLVSNFYCLASAFHNCLASKYHQQGYQYSLRVLKYTKRIVDIVRTDELQRLFESTPWPFLSPSDTNKQKAYEYCDASTSPASLIYHFKNRKERKSKI